MGEVSDDCAHRPGTEHVACSGYPTKGRIGDSDQ